MTARRLLRPLLGGPVVLGTVVGLWQALLSVFAVDPFLARTPADVWRYLTTAPDAAAHRERLAAGLGHTLADAALGFGCGLASAVGVALLFVLARPVRQALLPIAVLLRSVPLVAMTPLLILVFGRGLLATAVIAGLVVFFPALVTITNGLRTAARHTVELCRAYGAGSWTIARAVLLPAAVPAIFASARIGVPAALIGATLAEWLATGRGLGYEMLQDATTFDYDHLWAAVAALTLVSVLVYNGFALVESMVTPRFTDG
ncbi:ABC transporter permease subunit [Micromonospora fluostatini]|uniref:ABC transporter permease subunit n=1 Tax=Micromonospora fluostatini TaxID=1629071 RepID=A0ABY2DKX9_9ACTN|nr:ABC transporter permease subunit [Micromonospora fluostatini]